MENPHMVNWDRSRSTFVAQCRAIADATTSVRLRCAVRLRSAATQTRTTLDPLLRTIDARIPPAVRRAGTTVRSEVSPRVRAFNAASPKVKAIACGGALVVLTGIAAPIAVTQGGSSAAAASATAWAPDGTDGSGSLPSDGSPVASDDAAAKTTVTDKKDNHDTKAPAAPTVAQLHPVGIQGYQSDFGMDTDQMRNAQKIIQAGQAMGLPPRAWVIALATSMQESKLINYGNLGWSNDHDSLGLFQQRPSSGWGSPRQVQDPTYAAKAFYRALIQIPHWDRMQLTDAAQAVQVSAFGDRYAQWEAHAGDVVNGFYGHGPLAKLANKVM
jgi:hypothetical protein